MDINARQRDILAAIVREYVLRGEPVGSRTLVKHQSIEQSAATVRNVMADLEDQGFLSQPHASAGRVPTEVGLRFFVDRLMKVKEISEKEKKEILARYQLSDLELRELLREISKLLCDVSQQCALVLVPRSELSILKRIDFARLAEDKLIAIIIMSSGLVQNRLLRAKISDRELSEIHDYLNHLCVGKSLSEVRRLVQENLENEQSLYDEKIRKSLELGAEVLNRTVEDELVIEGKSKLLDLPAVDHQQTKELLEEIERKRLVLKLLDETMAADGVKVFIGAETEEESLRNCSIIARSYGGDAPLGTIGVLGPTNINYSRVISLVDFTAGILTHVLNR